MSRGLTTELITFMDLAQRAGGRAVLVKDCK